MVYNKQLFILYSCIITETTNYLITNSANQYNREIKNASVITHSVTCTITVGIQWHNEKGQQIQIMFNKIQSYIHTNKD